MYPLFLLLLLPHNIQARVPQAGENRCITDDLNWWFFCTGNSNCTGELDWCREEARKEKDCLTFSQQMSIDVGRVARCLPMGSSKEGGNGTNSIPGQCIQASKMRDGKENNCLDRSDEDPFQEAANATNKETIIDPGRLKNCTIIENTNSDGQQKLPGLECGGIDGRWERNGCIGMYEWCRDKFSKECPVLGPGIRTNDPVLCSNNTFWRTQPCGKDPDSSDSDEMIRCLAGNSGQCVTKFFWGMKGRDRKWDGGGWENSCKDGSDKYRPIKQRRETKEPDRQLLHEDSSIKEHSGDQGVIKCGIRPNTKKLNI